MGGYGNVTAAASNIRTDYLRLLVTQLRNQNPMDPMDNSEMASQLTLLSQLEQLENQSDQLQGMSATFQQALLTAQHSHATGLLGKEITFPAYDQVGRIVEMSGQVERVDIVDGQVQLTVGDYIVGLGGIVSIRN